MRTYKHPKPEDLDPIGTVRRGDPDACPYEDLVCTGYQVRYRDATLSHWLSSPCFWENGEWVMHHPTEETGYISVGTEMKIQPNYKYPSQIRTGP